MAIIYMDSFDHYATADFGNLGWRGVDTYSLISAGAGRYGTSAFYCNANNGYGPITRTLSSSPSTIILGFAFKPVYSGSAYRFLRLYDSSETCHISMAMAASTNQLIVYRGDGTTALGTGATVLTYNVWCYVELKVYIADSGGTVHLRVNGIPDLSLTSQDTRNGGTASISIVTFGGGGSGQLKFYMDDLYIADTNGTNNDFLGDTRIEYLKPTAAGVKTQFTPSTGSNWQNVDDATPSDADYNSSNVLGAMDLFTMSDLAGNGEVRGVQTVVRHKKDDAGHRGVLPTFYKASGTGDTGRFYTGSRRVAYDSFAYGLPFQIYDTSPDTGSAWTIEEVNAIEYGYAVADAGMFTLDAVMV